MYYSFTGEIIHNDGREIALSVGNVAYSLLTPHPEEFPVGRSVTVYVYEVYSEAEHYLVGFSDLLEKEAFLSLIAVKGIGPKTALGALSAAAPEDLYKAISASNVAYLKKLPGIGPKAAAQIILDLKGKLAETGAPKGSSSLYPEVSEALKSLGFKPKEIDEALAAVSVPGMEESALLKAALKALRGKGRK